MTASERGQKFTRFKELQQAGQLSSQEIVNQLGISKNTLYNWRKRLKTMPGQAIPLTNHLDSAFPRFTKIIPQQKTSPSVCHCIEIAIGSTTIIRIPETLDDRYLQQLFTIIEGWGCYR
jgi:hypothetical protein